MKYVIIFLAQCHRAFAESALTNDIVFDFRCVVSHKFIDDAFLFFSKVRATQSCQFQLQLQLQLHTVPDQATRYQKLPGKLGDIFLIKHLNELIYGLSSPVLLFEW